MKQLVVHIYICPALPPVCSLSKSYFIRHKHYSSRNNLIEFFLYLMVEEGHCTSVSVMCHMFNGCDCMSADGHAS